MLNVQTEHLENHTARLTVELEAERVEQAMRQAARRISKKSRIPGFRPGKAPYNVVLNLFGREYVLGEAIDDLGNAAFREALEAADIDPYAPGNLEDVQDNGQKLVFIVPKRPTVDLGDYRALRFEETPTEITDDTVNDAMEHLRQSEALVEPVERPAALGDMVTFSHFEVLALGGEDSAEDAADADAEEVEEAESADSETPEAAEDEAAVEAEDSTEDAADASAEDAEEVEDTEDFEDADSAAWSEADLVLHEHDFDRVLRDDEDDFFPGFSPEFVGASVGDEIVFTLNIPEDFDNEEIAGRTVRVEGTVKQVALRTVPEWTDELAARVSEGKQETMLELRVDTRRQLEENAAKIARQNLANKMLEAMVENASIHYPAELVDDYLDDLLKDLEQNVLKRQGLTLKDYMRIVQVSEEDLRNTYREQAAKRAANTLVFGQFVVDEGLHIASEDIDAEIERLSALMGGSDQAELFKGFLSTPQSRTSILNDLVSAKATDQLAAIARGENPPKGSAQSEAVEAEASADAEPEAAVAELPEEDAPAAEATVEEAVEPAESDETA